MSVDCKLVPGLPIRFAMKPHQLPNDGSPEGSVVLHRSIDTRLRAPVIPQTSSSSPAPEQHPPANTSFARSPAGLTDPCARKVHGLLLPRTFETTDHHAVRNTNAAHRDVLTKHPTPAQAASYSHQVSARA